MGTSNSTINFGHWIGLRIFFNAARNFQLWRLLCRLQNRSLDAKFIRGQCDPRVLCVFPLTWFNLIVTCVLCFFCPLLSTIFHYLPLKAKCPPKKSEHVRSTYLSTYIDMCNFGCLHDWVPSLILQITLDHNHISNTHSSI